MSSSNYKKKKQICFYMLDEAKFRKFRLKSGRVIESNKIKKRKKWARRVRNLFSMLFLLVVINLQLYQTGAVEEIRTYCKIFRTLDLGFKFLEKWNHESKVVPTRLVGHPDDINLAVGEACYYDIESRIFKIYDFTEFNLEFNKFYCSEFVLNRITYNSVYHRISLAFAECHKKMNYEFFHPNFGLESLNSFFIQVLRSTKTFGNYELKTILEKFPVPFFCDKVTSRQTYDFLIMVIAKLVEFNVFSFDQETNILKIYPRDWDELTVLLNCSFNALVFGLRVDCLKIDNNFEFNIGMLKTFVSDYESKNFVKVQFIDEIVLNYLISSTTNYLHYSKTINNLLLEIYEISCIN